MNNRKTFYHIFEVADYKGGELISKYNLSKEKFHEALMDIFNIYEMPSDYDGEHSEPFTKEEVRNFIPNSSLYAGGDSYVYTLLQTTEDGELKQAEIDYQLLADLVNNE